MKKRGQLTIFIIIAIVLVAIVGIFFILRGGIGIVGGDTDADKVYAIIENCAEGISEDLISYTGLRGGYVTPPNFSVEERIPYYYYEGKNHMPSKLQIENQLSLKIEKNIDSCIKEGFDNFQEFEVAYEKITSKIEIKEGEVTMKITSPITITKDGSNNRLEELKEVIIPIRIGLVYDIAEQIIQQRLEDEENICLTCIYDLVEKTNLKINIYEYDENTIIFIISDEVSIVNSEPFEFMFAMER